MHKAGLPENAGTANPLDLLAPEHTAEFRDVNSRVKDPSPDDSELPKPCYRVSRSSEVELRRAVVNSGTAVLVRGSCTPKTKKGRLLLGGLFGVPHNDRLRVIFDRRLQNMGEHRLQWAVLPQGCMLCRIVLEPGQGCRGSGGT